MLVKINQGKILPIISYSSFLKFEILYVLKDALKTMLMVKNSFISAKF